MGVSKYIEEISSKIEEKIQKNLESIEAASDPKDGLEKDRQNEILREVDPSALLSSRYSAFLDGLANSGSVGSKLTLADVLQSDGDTFGSTYDLLISDARERGILEDLVEIDASTPTVIAAFAELSNKGAGFPGEAASPINEEGTRVSPTTEIQSVVNLPSPSAGPEESVEKVLSAVIGAKVEIPEEIPSPESPISINLENAPIPRVEQSTPETRVERFENNTLTSETIGPTQTAPQPVSQNSSTAINSATVSNEISSNQTVTSQSTPSLPISSIPERYLGPTLSTEQNSITDRSFEKDSSSITQTINSKEKAGPQQEKESLVSTSSESKSTINSSEKGESRFSTSSGYSETDLKYFESLTGINLSSFVGEKASSESKTAVETREKEKVGGTEKLVSSQERMGVTKEAPSFPERIMPSSSPMVLTKEIQKATASEVAQVEQPVKVEPVKSIETEVPMRQANEMPATPSPSQPTQVIGLDELNRRMSRIEYLLSNPLEVKLVD